MDSKKAAKIATLCIAVASMILVVIARGEGQGEKPLFDGSLAIIKYDWSSVGIYKHCEIFSRLAFHFFHANIFHAILNVWCLLSVAFLYNITLTRIIIAFIIASLTPTCCLSATPTVGLSAMLFALFASLSFEVKRKLYYQAWMIAYIAIGFCFPNTNALIHLYAYTAGFALALLNKPFKR